MIFAWVKRKLQQRRVARRVQAMLAAESSEGVVVVNPDFFKLMRARTREVPKGKAKKRRVRDA